MNLWMNGWMNAILKWSASVFCHSSSSYLSTHDIWVCMFSFWFKFFSVSLFPAMFSDPDTCLWSHTLKVKWPIDILVVFDSKLSNMWSRLANNNDDKLAIEGLGKRKNSKANKWERKAIFLPFNKSPLTCTHTHKRQQAPAPRPLLWWWWSQ